MVLNQTLQGLGILLLTTMALGCGGPDGPEVASVTGTVKMDGNPLPEATVTFIPVDGEGGRAAVGKTDSEGKYALSFSGGRKGAIPGKNKVKISTGQSASEDDEGKTIPGVPEKVPMKYNAKTELEFTVEPGKENVADFVDLKSGGPILKLDDES